MLTEQTMIYPSDVSPDGSVLLYTRATGLSTDVFYVSLGADRTPHPFVQTANQERDGQFSADGKWVAYQSNEAGHFEIYLQPFPGPGNRIPVSAGQHVRWAKNTSEMSLLRPISDCIDSRHIRRDGTLFSAPSPPVSTELDSSFLTRQRKFVSPDGQRFLMNAATHHRSAVDHDDSELERNTLAISR